MNKKDILDNILAMSKPCTLTDKEIEAEVETGKQEFNDNLRKKKETYH